MAYLIRRKRNNPASGKIEIYYLLQERGEKATGLGFISEKTANNALTVHEGRRLDEAAGLRQPTTSLASSAPPLLLPTVREWWGEADLRQPVAEPSRMHQWAIAQGKVGNALRVMNDSRKVFFADPVGALRLDAVVLMESDAFIARLRAAGCRSRTIQIRVGHLQLGLNAARDYSVLKSPAKLKAPPNTDKKPTVFHTPEQARQLVEQLRHRLQRGFIDTTSLLAIAADITCGLRKGELLSRRWTDLDWSAGALRIDDQAMPDGTVWRPKNDKSRRTVSIPPDLLALFREEWMLQGRGAGWIFPAEGTNKPRADFRKALASACKAAGLPVLHPHALRHTWATGWLWSGQATMSDLVAEGGWSSPAVPSATYVHTASDRRRGIAAAASPLSSPVATQTTSADLGADHGPETTSGLPAVVAKKARRS